MADKLVEEERVEENSRLSCGIYVSDPFENIDFWKPEFVANEPKLLQARWVLEDFLAERRLSLGTTYKDSNTDLLSVLAWCLLRHQSASSLRLEVSAYMRKNRQHYEEAIASLNYSSCFEVDAFTYDNFLARVASDDSRNAVVGDDIITAKAVCEMYNAELVIARSCVRERERTPDDDEYVWEVKLYRIRPDTKVVRRIHLAMCKGRFFSILPADLPDSPGPSSLVRIRIDGEPHYVELQRLRNRMPLEDGFVSQVVEDPNDPDYVLIQRVDVKSNWAETILRVSVKPIESENGNKDTSHANGAGGSNTNVTEASGRDVNGTQEHSADSQSHALLEKLTEIFSRDREQTPAALKRPSDLEQLWPLFQTVNEIFGTIQTDDIIDLDAKGPPDNDKDTSLLQALQRDLGALEDKLEKLEMELKELQLKGPGSVFFYGFPGRGKTTLVNSLIKLRMPTEKEFKDMNAAAIKRGGVEEVILDGKPEPKDLDKRPRQGENALDEGLFVLSNEVTRSDTCGAILDTDAQVLELLETEMDFYEDDILPTSGLSATTTCVPISIKFADCFRLDLHYKSFDKVAGVINQAKILSKEIKQYVANLNANADNDNENENESEDDLCPSITHEAYEAMAMIGAPKDMVSFSEDQFRELEESDFVVAKRFQPRLGKCRRITIRGPTLAEAQDRFRRLVAAHTVGSWSHFGLLESVTAYVPAVKDERWRSMEFFDAAGFAKEDPYRIILTQRALERPFHILVHVMDKAASSDDEKTGLVQSKVLSRIVYDPASHVVIPFVPWDKESKRPTDREKVINHIEKMSDQMLSKWKTWLKHAVSPLSDLSPAMKKSKRAEMEEKSNIFPLVLSVIKDTPYEELKLEKLVERLLEEQSKKLERDARCKVEVFYKYLHQAISDLEEICEKDALPKGESASLFKNIKEVGKLLTSQTIGGPSIFQVEFRNSMKDCIDRLIKKCTSGRMREVLEESEIYKALKKPKSRTLGTALRHGADKNPLETPLPHLMIGPLRNEAPEVVLAEVEDFFHTKAEALSRETKAPIENALRKFSVNKMDGTKKILDRVIRKLSWQCKEALESHEQKSKDELAKFDKTVDDIIYDNLPKYLGKAYKKTNATARFLFLGANCQTAAKEIGGLIETQAWNIFRNVFGDYSKKLRSISNDTIRSVKIFNSADMEELKNFGLAPHCRKYALLFAEVADKLRKTFPWVTTAVDSEDESRLDALRTPPVVAVAPAEGTSRDRPIVITDESDEDEVMIHNPPPQNPVVKKEPVISSPPVTPRVPVRGKRPAPDPRSPTDPQAKKHKADSRAGANPNEKGKRPSLGTSSPPDSTSKKPRTEQKWPCLNKDCQQRERDFTKRNGARGGPSLCKLCGDYFRRTGNMRPDMPVRSTRR